MVNCCKLNKHYKIILLSCYSTTCMSTLPDSKQIFQSPVQVSKSPKCSIYMHANSPGFKTNLPDSRTGQQISQIGRKILQIRVFTLILGGNFDIIYAFLWVNWQNSIIFNSVLRIEKRCLDARLAVFWILMLFWLASLMKIKNVMLKKLFFNWLNWSSQK